MYVRLFDVDWSAANNAAVPLAPIHLPQQLDTMFTYVPVVFITQNALVRMSDTSIAELAGNIASLTEQMCDAANIHPQEVQIDCDWTSTLRDKYFSILKYVKQQPYLAGKILSCTIRMHQAKYTRQSGIPPVDKGLLMCYNMGDLKKYNTQNSIIDMDEAKLYLKHLDTYPLQLDVALPLFRWCLLFRDGRFKGILRDVRPDDVISNNMFTQQQDNIYRSNTDTSWKGYYFRTGDVVRTEAASPTVLEAMANYTAAHIKNNALNVVFFDCDSLILSKYKVDELEKVYTAYK
ncbi:MAG: hypothetical protein P4L41_03590 [Flavipsychrobacter sp.]|nr:hypothetical protein [Flavipsychrobacter sp.]